LDDPAVFNARKTAWQKVVDANGGLHPNCGHADTRLLHRMREMGVPATRGGGMHPNRKVWVRDARTAEKSGFEPSNKYH
jgi:dihydroxy-acid dehydratase